MSRTKPLPKRPERSRIHIVLPGPLHEEVDRYCVHHDVSEREFFRLAARERLDGLGDAQKLRREMRALRRTVLVAQLQSTAVTELFRVYLRHWTRSTPPLPDAELRGLERKAVALETSMTEEALRNVSAGNPKIARLLEELLPTMLEDAPAAERRTAPERRAGD